MNEMQIFQNAQFGQLRISKGADGEPWFCLVDVCKALSLTQPSRVKQSLRQDGVTTIKGVSNTTNQFGVTTEQEVLLNFINEPNFYKCIFQSRKKEADIFQDWVCGEVLPSIRKNGGYIVERKEDTAEDIMARAVLVAQQTLAKREQRIRELEAQTELQASTIDAQKRELTAQAPKAEYYDKTLASTDCITTTQVADDLGMSAKALNAKLRENGIIYHQSGQWHLTAKFKAWNLHGTRTYSYTKEDGTTGTKQTLVWNQRGKRFILAMYRNGFDLRQAIAEIKGSACLQTANS